jgi:hypothetical protein
VRASRTTGTGRRDLAGRGELWLEVCCSGLYAIGVEDQRHMRPMEENPYQSPSGMDGMPPKAANPPHEVRHQHTLIPAFLGFLVLIAERIVRTGEPPVFAGTVFLVVLFLVCLLHDWASGMRRYRSHPLDVAIMTIGLVATIVVGYVLALDDVFLRLITLGELLVGIGIIHWLRDR